VRELVGRVAGLEVNAHFHVAHSQSGLLLQERGLENF
jgi:hypothetical protein